jgi:hypothetical protein
MPMYEALTYLHGVCAYTHPQLQIGREGALVTDSIPKMPKTPVKDICTMGIYERICALTIYPDYDRLHEQR